ncbi:hypothetical protein N0V90_010343 [Kalmusia sp. IMI 367209]|nr:hypothetical protein N0V90_010343 [Kalmusia sp. IMI 367209]
MMSKDTYTEPSQADANRGTIDSPVEIVPTSANLADTSIGHDHPKSSSIVTKDSIEISSSSPKQVNFELKRETAREDQPQNDSSTIDAVYEHHQGPISSRETSPGIRKRVLAGPYEEPATKKSKDSEPKSPRFPSPPHVPATVVDKAKWQGYCEIESEPAYFSVILREIGIEGAAVEELHMMDPEDLITKPPIYGLVLLFRHRQFDTEKQEDTCPKHVWFANQMPGQNSCATLAMIHTLLNVDDPDIDIGEHMRQFKDFTKDMTPVHRGQTFASWNFVKKIHNSFAKKMDMLENDKYVAAKAARAAKAKAAGLIRSKSRSKEGRRNSTESDDSVEAFEEHAHHYIAFVPVNGDVWKLDGMDTQPTLMGTYNKNQGEMWFDALSDRINKLIAAGDNDYGIFAITQSPIVPLRNQICEADNTIKHVDNRLTALNTDWKALLDEEDWEPPSPSWLGDISEQQRAASLIPGSIKAAIDEDDEEALLIRHRKLVAKMRRMVVAYQDELDKVQEENDRAEQRRWDYGPAIAAWLGQLARNGFLEENIHLFKEK